MKITICGSIAFIDEMHRLKPNLEALGHEVKLPPAVFMSDDGKQWDSKDYYKFKKSEPFNDPHFLKTHHQRIRDHFEKVAWGDCALITNFDKNGIANYIGPNTLMEMGVAFYLHKPIYLLYPIPEVQWKEEIIGMKPVVISGDLNLIA